MMAGMLAVALFLRWRQMLKWWPVIIVFAGFTHYAAPGAISHMYWALTPEEGLVAEQQGRAGQAGSGRVADFRPGIDRWLDKPLVGHGLGLGRTTGGPPTPLDDSEERRRVIYDNQWLQVLISLGVLGFIGAVWFVWGAVIKLARAARRTVGDGSNLLAAVAVACTGYGVGMLTYDSFAFVQVTLLFFVIAALGLRARTLLQK
jgi:hypothetical protein